MCLQVDLHILKRIVLNQFVQILEIVQTYFNIQFVLFGGMRLKVHVIYRYINKQSLQILPTSRAA